MSSLRQYAIILFILILSQFAANPANTLANNEGHPEFIPVTHEPCCLECSYSLPYCYNYNISNMNNGIKVKEWEVDNGWINGRAVADIDANLIIKMCFQLSLSASYVLLDEELDLETEFTFKVKISSSENSKGWCIDKEESEIIYLTFLLKGNLDSDPIPEVGAQLVDDIQSMIEHSIYQTAYDLLNKQSLPGNEENNNLYCHPSQNDSESEESPCPCY